MIDYSTYFQTMLSEKWKESAEGIRAFKQKKLDELSPKASPRNGAWKQLEDLGFEPDYSDADAGEPPKGAQW